MHAAAPKPRAKAAKARPAPRIDTAGHDLGTGPGHDASLHLQGLLAHRSGDPDRAADLLARAVTLRPEAAHYRSNLANALRDLGRLPEAIAQYRAAERLRPGTAEIQSNLGTILADLGDLDQAVTHYQAAHHLDPTLPEPPYNLANILVRLGQAQAAEASFQACLAIDPTHAGAHYNLAGHLAHQHRLDEAEHHYRAALAQKPGWAAAWNNLGVLLQRADRIDLAAECHAMATQLDPANPAHHYNLGCVELARNRADQAASHYHQVLAIDPTHAPARFALCMAQLPILYASETELQTRRAAYAHHLDQLCIEARHSRGPHRLAPGVGASPPFFLPYQGQDDLALQRSHGNLVCRAMHAAYPPAPMPKPPAPGEPVRLGLVSGFFHQHTLWSLMLQGWLDQIDPARFTLLAYHTGSKRDACTEHAASRCTRFVQGPLPPDTWRDTILQDAPQILLYPEIGIDPVAARLGAQRLAPVQCAAWGHPTTTGLPTIDHFLTGAAMETPGADGHYAENLIRLPGLGIHVQPPEPGPTITRAELGLREDATLFWSGQALYKYLPQHDAVFVRIARAVPNAQFAFIAFARNDGVTRFFQRRLHNAFAEAGLDAATHCVILPAMEPEIFRAAIGLADIVLDTIAWSGGRSTLDALAHSPPIVTLPGPLMRSRHTAAMLALMDIGTTTATDLDDYVAIATRLAHDPAERAAFRTRTAANKHRLFSDQTGIAALEDFLETAARTARPAPLLPGTNAPTPHPSRPTRLTVRSPAPPGSPGRPASARSLRTD